MSCPEAAMKEIGMHVTAALHGIQQGSTCNHSLGFSDARVNPDGKPRAFVLIAMGADIAPVMDSIIQDAIKSGRVDGLMAAREVKLNGGTGDASKN